MVVGGGGEDDDDDVDDDAGSIVVAPVVVVSADPPPSMRGGAKSTTIAKWISIATTTPKLSISAAAMCYLDIWISLLRADSHSLVGFQAYRAEKKLWL